MSYSHVYKERGSRARQSPSDSSLLEIFPSNTPRTLAAYALLFVVGAIWLLSSPNIYPILSFSARMLWNTLVYITPPSLILALEKKYTPSDTAASATYEASRTFPAKSEAMQRILGLERMGVVASLQRSRSLSIASIFKSPPSKTLPGLGNWDNSCYQNSVLQGLASLSSLPAFLEQVVPYTKEKDGQLSTNIALRGLIEQLNDPKNAGRRIWTPYVLKNMSSFQQQDAQEYYSKVVDELEKEVVKSLKVRPQGKGLVGLKELTSPIESGSFDGTYEHSNGTTEFNGILNGSDSAETHPKVADNRQSPTDSYTSLQQNPLEGLLAQRVGCLKCGFVEGLSLIPFNCLTLPLGRQRSYDIETCLDNYTALEPISGVECAHCTLLQHKHRLEQTLDRKTDSSPEDTNAIHALAQARLDPILAALEASDFSEATLAKKCMIPSKLRISTTKSRQAVIARPPKSLVLHVNRSIFDERTGALRKNSAAINFPTILDLAPWCLGSQTSSNLSGAASPTSSSLSSPEIIEKADILTEIWEVNPNISMLSSPAVSEFSGDSDKDYISETEAKIPNDSPSYAPNTLYALRALVTHYGRHENGHYIAYRQGSISTEDDECPWWRLSDDDVSMIHEDDVMNQGGVFMLFYERLAGDKDVKEHLAKGEAEEPQINGMPVEDRDVKQGTVKEPLTEKEVEKPHINDIPVELEASIEQSANAPLANGQSLEQRKELLLG